MSKVEAGNTLIIGHDEYRITEVTPTGYWFVVPLDNSEKGVEVFVIRRQVEPHFSKKDGFFNVRQEEEVIVLADIRKAIQEKSESNTAGS